MIFGLFYFCVVILCVNRSRSSFIRYKIVKRHSRQSNVRRIWTCADNESFGGVVSSYPAANQIDPRTRFNQSGATHGSSIARNGERADDH